MKIQLAAALALLLPFAAARADVMTLSVTSDTFIVDGGSADNNSGANSSVIAGMAGDSSRRRALLQFDFSLVPFGAVVTSAVFNLEVNNVPGGFMCPPGGQDSTFHLFAISAPWKEGVQGGNSGSGAATGEVTWNSRFHGVSAWTNAGGDFDSNSLASAAVSGIGPYTWSDAGLLAAVQNWVLSPTTHHGLLLKSDGEDSICTARRFGGREGAQPATLTIGFIPPSPPTAATFTMISVVATNPTNAVLTLAWSNTPGMKYDVLYDRDLGGTQAWKLAEANIPVVTNAVTNTWREPPFLASPNFQTNDRLFYAVRSLHASQSGMPVRLQVVVSNLVSPVVMTYPPDGTDRLFVCEQRGQILVVDSNRALLPTPFLDLSLRMTNLAPTQPSGTNFGIASGYDERGLLGLAFHPGYVTNRKFYVYFSSPKYLTNAINHESIVAEFLCSTTNANIADPSSERIVLRFDQPEFNHNGGNLAFGPDGFLYIATGDGGGAGDVHGQYGNAQILTNLLGKMLRIDVDGALPYAIPPDNPFATNGPPVRAEIFAYGFRNPWKASFDGTNCWVADVGQNIWEEINWLRAGRNYGWRILEASRPFNVAAATNLGVNIPDLEFPIHEYRHGTLGISITGGFVYRGTNYPAMQGRYVFGDYSKSFGTPSGSLYYLEETRANIWERFAFWLAPTGAPLGRYVKSFGRDQNGEIYLLSTTVGGPTGNSGDIRQLLPP